MILVTGHLGFVGRHLLKALEGQDVFGIDIKAGLDILTCKLPEADRVYHLAAQTDAQSLDATADAEVNIIGTLRLLGKYGSALVLASTSMVRHPDVPYAISKRAAEDYARVYGAAVVRFCNLYGAGGHSAMDRFRDDDVIEIRGSGEQRRTYAPVADAVTALLSAEPGQTTILPGVDYTVNELAAMYPGKPIRRVPAPRHDPMNVTQ